MIGRISTIFQFILGFILGIILISGTAVGLGFLYVSKMTQIPPKPVFSEETAQPPSENQTEAKKPATSPEETTSANFEPKTIPTKEKPEEEVLPPNAYKARVTWEQGLSLRDEPDLSAARIGGIEHNAEIIILEESQDKQWQRVRLPWSAQEGWVKAGNVERIY
ncbi:SH3 type 3 domain protein [Stanieria cyanosphaera PCC 7437]|uniref:SH3 type 3 domain protein n=1 Tax=Stanieria cyanosphaera (strain ATCC 29371 / PCC 7437) TaxID=111780 RepID=K9XV67_STAC7|nr:SH3 domain-containing protein [Stanieria cyanosphaera]AFZ36438.1 SH3 type 3 domain protein [Stanieria cyanosphaera PCC 7437]